MASTVSSDGSAAPSRYSTVAILFHWVIAAALAVQIMLGWRLEGFEGFSRIVMLQVHKSVGIAILLLSIGRLTWRLMNPPPPPVSQSKALETLALWAHRSFYFALLALPLTGWAISSIGRPGALKLFWAVKWPAIPFLGLLPAKAQDSLSDVLHGAHSALVWVMLGLLVLHIAGALKHHFIGRDETIGRMAPGVRPGQLQPRLALIPLTLGALAAAVYLPAPKPPPARPKVVRIESADVYLDVVGPALDRRCGACHNDEEARGGLSLASYDGLMQGTFHGPVVKPGVPTASELYKRIALPKGHDLFMPKGGRTPLSKDEVSAIQWWIAQGAPAGAKVGQMKLTPEAKAALLHMFNAEEAADQGARREIPLPVVAPADAALVARLNGEGFVLRKVKRDSNLLEADYIGVEPATEALIADLVKLGPNLLRLNLRKAGISDAMVKALSTLPNLRQLRLEANPVTDAAMPSIAALQNLAYLNLTNTKVTDAGLQQLASMPKLERLYVWGDPVTESGARAVRGSRSGVTVYAGLTAKDVPPPGKAMEPVN